MQVKIKKPCTVYIKFTGSLPNRFSLCHDKHGLYYFRDLQGKAPRIKFNLCHPGVYRSNTPFEVVKVVPIEVPDTLPGLPPYERNEIKDFVIKHNPDLTGSPARVYAKDGVVETGQEFNSHPKPIRAFILLHEIGHFFYGLTDADYVKANKMPEPLGRDYIRKKRNESEVKCDLFALIHYLQMGYNRSMAFYALATVLSRSKDNVNRLKELIKNIQKTQTNAIIFS
ncbi:MAG TPA: hypothetical protein VF487_13190 [Chitinophagaceae bacterium]